MKLHVLYYCGEYGECNIFFGNNLTQPISVVSLNDAHWRHEYLDPVMEDIGVEVIRLDQYSFGEGVLEAMLSKWFGY